MSRCLLRVSAATGRYLPAGRILDRAPLALLFQMSAVAEASICGCNPEGMFGAGYRGDNRVGLRKQFCLHIFCKTRCPGAEHLGASTHFMQGGRDGSRRDELAWA